MPKLRFAEPGDAYLQQLRRDWDLDALIKDCTTDLDRVRSVCAWVHGRWEHTSNARPERNDPHSILAAAKAGGRFRCVEYAIVLAGCLNALGIPARTLNLMPRDIETSFGGAGHMVVEAFLRDVGRWQLADPQFDAVVTVAGQPANAVELQAALAHAQSVDYGPHPTGSAESYRAYIGNRLFYFRTAIDHRPAGDGQATRQIMLVPLAAPEPRVFERVFPITNCFYTHSVHEFYQPPQRE